MADERNLNERRNGNAHIFHFIRWLRVSLTHHDATEQDFCNGFFIHFGRIFEFGEEEEEKWTVSSSLYLILILKLNKSRRMPAVNVIVE